MASHDSSSCCGGRPCGGPKNIQKPTSDKDHKIVVPALATKKDWKRAPNGQDQFEAYPDYDDGLENDLSHERCNIEKNNTEQEQGDPWVYDGKSLQALEFPLGGFGTSSSRIFIWIILERV